MDLERQIREYVLTELLYDRQLPSIADDESLLGAGMLDSLAVMRLVLWLEEQYGVQLLDDEVVPENLDSVRHIADLLRRKKAGTTP